MLLKDLIRGLSIDKVQGSLDIEISDIAYDSRKVRKGSVFVCIKGTKVDGHEYIQYALENGATALVVQNEVESNKKVLRNGDHADISSCFVLNVGHGYKVEVPENITVIQVSDSRYALAFLSDAFYSHPSGEFNLVGVTGTKGKTTITYMIKSVLEEAGQKIGLIGTIANQIGDEVLHTERTTPESYDLQSLFSEMKHKQVDSVVMEVSSHALELHRVSRCDYNIGVFNNLSQDHLDFHLTFENYLNAKLKLFSMCKKGLVNIDNDYGEQVVKRAGCELYTYGIEENADIKAFGIKYYADKVEFHVHTPWMNSLDEYEEITVNIPGRFSVYNALAAIGVCCLMGIPFDTIRAGLSRVSVPGRAEVVETGKDFTIIIDYAHSPDSLENILQTVRGYAPARVVCMFGCGGDRDMAKRPMMGEISGKLADFTIITSDNPRTEDPDEIITGIEKGILNTDGEYVKITERRDAIKFAIENAKPEDIIVLAGKGHETYQLFKDKTIHFDEREVVKEILDKMNIRGMDDANTNL